MTADNTDCTTHALAVCIIWLPNEDDSSARVRIESLFIALDACILAL